MRARMLVALLAFLIFASGTASLAQTVAYVANLNSDDLSVIDTATYTVVRTIPLGLPYHGGPAGLALTRDGRFLYVTEAVGTVLVLDTATYSVVATISLLGDNPSGGVGATDVVISPDGAWAYVVQHNTNSVSVIDTATLSVVATAVVGTYPVRVAFSPDSGFAYVTNQLSDTVSVIETATHSVVATIPVGKFPGDIAVVTVGTDLRAYVTNWNTTVSVIDLSTNNIISSIPVEGAWTIEGSVDGSFVAIAQWSVATNGVTIIDTATNSVRSTLALPVEQANIKLTSDDAFAYVTDFFSDKSGAGHSVFVVDIKANKIVTEVQVGLAPFGMAFQPAAPKPIVEFNALYANTSSGQVYKLDPTTGLATLWLSTNLAFLTDITFVGTHLYGIAGQQGSGFYSIDVNTGTPTLIAYFGVFLNALSAAPDGMIYAAALDPWQPSSPLYKIDPSSGAITLIGCFGGGLLSSGDLAFGRDGQLWATTNDSATGLSYLAMINKDSGVATRGPLLSFGSVYGLAFRNGVLYGVTSSGQFLNINTTTGAGTSIANDAKEWFGLATSPASPQRDFNGDGRADLIWSNRITGDVVFWLMNGMSVGSNVRIAGPRDRQWRIVAVADFNRDGSVDLVMRHALTGENQVWFMSGTWHTGTAALPTVVDSRWQIAAAVDFNGDRRADLLWRNLANGDVVVWYLEGATYVGYDWVASIKDVQWVMAGVDDFNGDGMPDIVWRNANDGRNLVWYMSGAVYGGFAWLPSEADTNWVIVGVADYDGDERADLLWRNQATGANRLWRMSNASLLGADALPAMTDVEYQAIGAETGRTRVASSDFNADGKPDILWHNETTGESRIWYMTGSNGATQLADLSIGIEADISWKAVAVADFNHDGLPDIVWRNGTTGENRIWLMEGRTHTDDMALPTIADANWKIVGVGDFNQDGHPDLAWRNYATGANVIWFLKNGSYSDWTAPPTIRDTDWKIVAVGDFNGDGWPDLFWRNQVTGVNIAWFLVNGVYAGWGQPPAISDPTWRIVGAADYNGDGKADLLWRNATTGQNLIWHLRDGAYLDWAPLPPLAIEWKTGVGQ